MSPRDPVLKAVSMTSGISPSQSVSPHPLILCAFIDSYLPLSYSTYQYSPVCVPVFDSCERQHVLYLTALSYAVIKNDRLESAAHFINKGSFCSVYRIYVELRHRRIFRFDRRLCTAVRRTLSWARKQISPPVLRRTHGKSTL